MRRQVTGPSSAAAHRPSFRFVPEYAECGKDDSPCPDVTFQKTSPPNFSKPKAEVNTGNLPLEMNGELLDLKKDKHFREKIMSQRNWLALPSRPLSSIDLNTKTELSSEVHLRRKACQDSKHIHEEYDSLDNDADDEGGTEEPHSSTSLTA